MLDGESLAITAEAREGHTAKVEHTQSQAQQPLNQKQSLCCWQFIHEELSHMHVLYVCMHIHKTDKYHYQIIVGLLGYFKVCKKWEEMNDIPAVHPLQT